MRPQTDPWRDLKQWYGKRVLIDSAQLVLLWIAYVWVLQRIAGRTPYEDFWFVGVITVLALCLPLLEIRSGRCPFLCPRCSRRFFGRKPTNRLRKKRVVKITMAHLARGPIKRKPSKTLRECAYCRLPLFARIRYVSTQDTDPL
jgi:hypothetical protein